MDEAVSYEEIALVLANHIYNNWCCDEQRPGRPPAQTFDTAGTEALEMAAYVLATLQLVEPVDGIPGRYVFLCTPDTFETAIGRHKAQGCGYETLVVAAIRLSEYTAFKEELLECLARLGVCRYTSSFFDPGNVPRSGVPQDVLKLVRELPRFEIEWTDKRKAYEDLARDQASLTR